MIEKISRRRFLQLTGMSTSGLVLMGSFPGLAGADVLAEAEGHELNLFVSVRNDGAVEIIAHRSEMGTGIRTSLPQIVADEMEADWGRVQVVQALGDKAYGSQNTDGSWSVRGFYTQMRQLGAAAKVMLEQAAADIWSVDIKEVSAQEHRVVHVSGKSLGFGELAETAARLPVPDRDALSLKSAEDFRYIGKSVPVVDLQDICSGQTTYGADVRLPGMLYASIERTPFLGGEVVSYDKKAARALPGVIDVVEIEARPLPARFNPQAGIAVVATDTFSAIKAREKLNVSWLSSDHASYSSGEHIEALAERVESQSGELVRERGDVENALQSASSVVEAVYKTPYLTHAPMEPPTSTAHIHDGICEIWAPTQNPQAVQQTVAQRLGLDETRVKVHVTLLGGGFGRKSKPDFSVESAILAQKLGKPVQVVWTREDDIKNGYFHSCSAQYYKAGLDKDGQVVGWLGREALPPITSIFRKGSNMMNDQALSQAFGSIPFDIPNIKLERLPADAQTRIGWLRSVYNIPFSFGIGSFVDELAHAANKNPRDFLLELIGEDRQLDFSSEGFKYRNHGQSLESYPFETARLKHVIRALTDSLPWDEQLPEGQGWGLSCQRSFLTYVAIASKVEIKNDRLSVLEMHGVIDAGMIVNPDRVHAQMEGAMIFGLSLALMGEISFDNGRAVQSNFHNYPVARMNQTPAVIKTHIVDSDAPPAGVGEPGVPPVAPSLANAVFAAGGQRIRDLPLGKNFTV